MGKAYELRCKVTRIFLADYLLLKAMSLETGASMAETLHFVLCGERKPTVWTAQVSSPIVTAKVVPVPLAKVVPVFIAQVPITSNVKLRATVARRV